MYASIQAEGAKAIKDFVLVLMRSERREDQKRGEEVKGIFSMERSNGTGRVLRLLCLSCVT